MGIAWFDDSAPCMDAPVLRTGGLPLLPDTTSWPYCSRCAEPLLFRAQVPLSITSLFAADEPRLLLAFECHAQADEDSCTEGAVLLVDSAQAKPRMPPEGNLYDLVLHSVGPNPARLQALISAMFDGETPPESNAGPLVLLQASVLAFASEAKRSVEELGGSAELVSFPPKVLPFVQGGRLVPFDDGQTGVRKTTLPPLANLVTNGTRRQRMRGLFGGSTPGYRDYSIPCHCGRHTRTVVRLFAQPKEAHFAHALSPAVVQMCLHCNEATLHRGYPTLPTANASVAATV